MVQLLSDSRSLGSWKLQICIPPKPDAQRRIRPRVMSKAFRLLQRWSRKLASGAGGVSYQPKVATGVWGKGPKNSVKRCRFPELDWTWSCIFPTDRTPLLFWHEKGVFRLALERRTEPPMMLMMLGLPPGTDDAHDARRAGHQMLRKLFFEWLAWLV